MRKFLYNCVTQNAVNAVLYTRPIRLYSRYQVEYDKYKCLFWVNVIKNNPDVEKCRS